MRARGLGLRRYAAVAAIVLAISLAAPALTAPVGAAPARSSARSEIHTRPAIRSALHAKQRRRKVRRRSAPLRPISAAKKRALLARYIKSHPGVVAAHASRPSVTLAKKLKTAAYFRAHPHKVKKKTRPKPRHKPVPAPKRKKATSAKKKKKKAAAVSGWKRDAMIVGGLAVAAFAVFLIGSSVLSGPRSRARARARRRRALAPR
jgi:hypothetical protein